ncbi:MAG: TetR/AcrR family transcriptional regulator [Oscillospiraceae bacterium]
MNREEKNLRTKQKIIDSAIVEFGKKSFGEASLNAVCKSGNISKGIIYHYFKDKDALYLACVKESYDALTKFLESDEYDFRDFKKGISTYFLKRYEFFERYPHYSQIFFSSVMQKPLHLVGEIRELRRDFDEQGIRYYRAVLEHITLRDEVSEGEAIEYFSIVQEMFNGYFQTKSYEISDFNALIIDHEKKLSKLLGMMIFGIGREQ